MIYLPKVETSYGSSYCFYYFDNKNFAIWSHWDMMWAENMKKLDVKLVFFQKKEKCIEFLDDIHYLYGTGHVEEFNNEDIENYFLIKGIIK